MTDITITPQKLANAAHRYSELLKKNNEYLGDLSKATEWSFSNAKIHGFEEAMGILGVPIEGIRDNSGCYVAFVFEGVKYLLT